jgi:hypothetical protein
MVENCIDSYDFHCYRGICNRFWCCRLLVQPPEAWNGGVGFVSQEMIKTHCPAPAEDIQVKLKCSLLGLCLQSSAKYWVFRKLVSVWPLQVNVSLYHFRSWDVALLRWTRRWLRTLRSLDTPRRCSSSSNLPEYQNKAPRPTLSFGHGDGVWALLIAYRSNVLFVVRHNSFTSNLVGKY